MNLEFKPQLSNRVIYLVNDYRLKLTTGLNVVDDQDWNKIKNAPEIEQLLESGDLVARPSDPELPAEKLTPVATETKPKAPAK